MAQDRIGETLAGSPQPFLKSKSGWSRRLKALSEGKRYTPPGGHLKFPTAFRNDNHPSFLICSSNRPPFPSSRTDIGKRRVHFADTNQVSIIPTDDQGNWTISAAPLSNGPSLSPSPSQTTNNSRSRVHNSKHSTFGTKHEKSRKIEEHNSSNHNEKDGEQSQLRSLDIAAAAACRAAATAELARIQAERAKLCQLRGEMQASISAVEHEKATIARKAKEIAYQNRKEKDEEIRRLRMERLALQRQGRLLTAAPAARAEKEKVAELQEALRNELSVKEAKEARYRLTIERIKKQLDEAHSRNAELADQVAALQRQQLEHLKAYPSSHHYNQRDTNVAAFFEREYTTTKQHHNMPDQQQRNINQQRPPPPLLSTMISNNNKHTSSSSSTYKTLDRVQQQSTNSHSMEKSTNKPWNPVLTKTKGRTPAVPSSHHKYMPGSSSFQQHTNSNTNSMHQQQSLPNNNGHWTQYDNGDIKRYYTDTGITEYLYYAVECWQVTVPLSSPLLLDNEDAATDHASSFARTYLTNNNNSGHSDDECPCIEVYYFSQGQVQANYPDGSKEILMPGTTTLHYKVTLDGQKTAATIGEMSSLVRRPMPSVSHTPDKFVM